jgi:hypothetical protein
MLKTHKHWCIKLKNGKIYKCHGFRINCFFFIIVCNIISFGEKFDARFNITSRDW